jgi:ubiquinone/menaquinone biosynthesis C-methylase UbiE
MADEKSINEKHTESAYTNPMQHFSGHMYDRLTAIMMAGRQKGIRKASIELARIKQGDRILEVGCGTGTLTMLAKNFAGPEGKVFGIDPLPQMVRTAQQKAQKAKLDITFQTGLMEEIPFSESMFDVVLASFMIFHTDEAIRQKGFEEVYRVLKPEGKFLIVDTQSPGQRKVSLADKITMHLAGPSMFENTLESLRPMLEASGFKSIEAGYARYAILGYLLSIK